MKKFVLHPGYAISREDWQYQWVFAGALMHLYQVTPDECIIDDGSLHYYSDRYLASMLHLYPMSGLDYRPVSDRERELYPL